MKFEELLKKLKKDEVIEDIKLNGIHIGDEGMKRLSLALIYNHHVKTISLKGNRISCKGCLVLARIIIKSKSIQVIDLSYNQIGE